MLNVFRERLDSNSFLSETFDYNKLIIKKDNLCYKGFKASKIILRRSWSKNNPWFSYLPLMGSKGEFIYIDKIFLLK